MSPKKSLSLTSSSASRSFKPLLLLSSCAIVAYLAFSASAPHSSPSSSFSDDALPQQPATVAVDLDASGMETTLEKSAKAATPALQMSSDYPVYEAVGTVGTNKDQEEVSAASVNVEQAPSAKEEAQLHERDDEIFEDAEAYRAAPLITSPAESTSIKYRMIVLQHERYYKTHPSRLYVPRLRKVHLSQSCRRFLDEKKNSLFFFVFFKYRMFV